MQTQPPPSTPAPPFTEAVKFTGSKRKLLPHILSLCQQTGARSVLDGFAGSTRVSQALARAGFTVHCNDHAPWVLPFGICYLQNPHPSETYAPLIDHLNALQPQAGWFTKHYGGTLENGKMPWQRHNTEKLDAIREAIDTLPLSKLERAVCLSSLMLALDEVDNTLGHHSSYLRQWSKRSFRNLHLKLPRYQPEPDPTRHQVSTSNVFDILPHTACELAYFDPPYGSNNDKMPPSRVRYAAYYHLWTTVTLNDQPETFGKALRRRDSSDTCASSVFEDFRKDADGSFRVLRAIQTLIEQTPCPWVLLSYSSSGRASARSLHELLERNGTIERLMRIDHRRNVMASMRQTDRWIEEQPGPHQELLFLLRKP